MKKKKILVDREQTLCAGATGRCHRAQHQVPYHTEEKYASESCHLQFDQPRAHNAGSASPILLLYHGVFTDRYFRVLFRAKMESPLRL